ncbi:MAG TPA: hypothetical protein PL070_19280, partial [Flavobacteriales bacterium]|nr:hypothetical protein [Flavobacteriales bacterium]
MTTLGGSWSAEPTAVNGYIWEVRTSGTPGDPGAVATGTTMSTSFSTSSGIVANTTYQVYVRSDCDTDGLSAWVGPVSVFTGYCVPGPNANLDPNGITNVVFANVD